MNTNEHHTNPHPKSQDQEVALMQKQGLKRSDWKTALLIGVVFSWGDCDANVVQCALTVSMAVFAPLLVVPQSACVSVASGHVM